MFLPGSRLAGKYVIERVIGQGGAGIVVAARHVRLDRRVAIKLVRPELATDPEAGQRFLREGRAAAQILSEHVVRILDAEQLDDGIAFIVMELLEGRDLDAALASDGPMAVDDAVDFLLQACEAVGEAHALGIVHRDVKPGNLFLTRTSRGDSLVKVLDFGLSRVRFSALTNRHQVLGSPRFMAPEQMRASQEADARSDVWSLGVVLYTLLTGEVPFGGTFVADICRRVLSGCVPRVTLARAEVPPAIEDAILRCLKQAGDERFQSTLELAQAVAPFAPATGAARVASIEAGTAAARARVAPSPP